MKLLAILVGVVVGICIGAAVAALVWLLWTHVAVAVFHAPAMTFWQTWGAILLVGFIVRVFRQK